jgi:uncharacterized protein DUF6912
MTALVFVPLSWDDVAALRSGADLGPRIGCAPNAELARRVGPAADPEEVEYAALNRAGDEASGTGDRRLVVAADVGSAQLVETGDGWGGVTATGLRWGQVAALFADDPSTAADATVGDDPDLLWFAPEELDRLRPA